MVGQPSRQDQGCSGARVGQYLGRWAGAADPAVGQDVGAVGVRGGRPRSCSTTTTAAPARGRFRTAVRTCSVTRAKLANAVQPIERIPNDAIVDCAVC
jgi:hypothetical protein